MIRAEVDLFDRMSSAQLLMVIFERLDVDERVTIGRVPRLIASR